MKQARNRKSDGKAEARRLAHLVQQAIDEGADTVEEIHRSIADLPLDVLERLDVFEKTVKDVRKVQETSIGAIYALIHKVNHEVGKLATDLLRRPTPRKAASRKKAPRKTAPRTAVPSALAR
jgi:hypothetical protein